MITNQENKMMTGAPAQKQFHFAGDGVWFAKTILADTVEEAEKLWHATKVLIVKSNAEGSAPTDTKVEDNKSNDVNE